MSDLPGAGCGLGLHVTAEPHCGAAPPGPHSALWASSHVESLLIDVALAQGFPR